MTEVPTRHTLTVQALGASAPSGTGPLLLEGAQVVLVHGFASTPFYNWERTRWIRQLQAHGAQVHLVTLPHHHLPGAVEPVTASYDLSSFQEGMLSAGADAMAHYLSDREGDIHLVGYSLGARICWNLATRYPQLANSLVVGAMPLTIHLRAVHRSLSSGTALPEGFTDILAGSPLPEDQLQTFTALPAEAFSPVPAPACPVLFFRGNRDTVAHDTEKAYHLLTPEQASWLEYPGRNHISILTSGKLRTAVIEFMVRHRRVPSSEGTQHTVA